jgi:hypothetical protein
VSRLVTTVARVGDAADAAMVALRATPRRSRTALAVRRHRRSGILAAIMALVLYLLAVGDIAVGLSWRRCACCSIRCRLCCSSSCWCGVRRRRLAQSRHVPMPKVRCGQGFPAARRPRPASSRRADACARPLVTSAPSSLRRPARLRGLGFQAAGVGDVDARVVDGDEPITLEVLQDLVERRPLHAEHGGEGALRELH